MSARVFSTLSTVLLACGASLSAQGPFLVEDIYPGGANNGAPQKPVAVGDRLVFWANTATKTEELWSSDGTSGGTFSLQTGTRARAIAGGATRAYMTNFSLGGDLWVTDGTLAGTTTVLVDPDRLTSSIVAVGDQLYAARVPFVFTPGASTVVTSDGSTVQTLATYPEGVSPRIMGRAGESAIWSTSVFPVSPLTIVSSSGGVLGTIPNVDRNWIFTGKRRLFFAEDNFGPNLYETDGVRLRTIYSGSGGSNGPRVIGVVDDAVYFRADDGNGPAIWVDDLKTPSPRIVGTFTALGLASADGPGAQLGDDLVFWGSAPNQSTEPWILEGQTAREIGQTPRGSSRAFVSVGSRHVYFYASSSVQSDAYSTDGVSLDYLGYGGSSTALDRIGVAGGLVYFSLWDSATGLELWAENPGATAQSFGVTCGGPWMRADDPVLGTTATIKGEANGGNVGTVLLSGGSVAPGTKILGCELYVNPTVSPVLSLGAFTVPANGEWSTTINVPTDPVYIGAPLLMQSAFIGSGQVTMSDGVVMFLGS